MRPVAPALTRLLSTGVMRPLTATASLAAFCPALWVIHRETANLSPGDIKAAIARIGIVDVPAAFLLSAASCPAPTGFDYLGLPNHVPGGDWGRIARRRAGQRGRGVPFLVPMTLPTPSRPAPSSPIPPDAADIVVAGGGPAGLIAAERLASAGFAVEIRDAMPTPARKLLMAGRGGLNLTHSEPPGTFATRYGDREDVIGPLVAAFGPADLRAWADGLGAETFVGSSGRVFPRALKASPLLRAWLARLAGLGVRLKTRSRLVGIGADGTLRFATPSGEEALRPKASLLALGGASWPRLGSDAAWVPLLRAHGARITPFRPSNCGFDAGWSAGFAARAAGEPVKNLELAFRGRRVRGEIVLTATGIEGGAVYALSAALRDAIEAEGEAWLHIDLRPQMTAEAVARRLVGQRGGESAANRIRKALGGGGPLYPLLRELAPDALGDPCRLAGAVKALPLRLVGVRPIERAISSAGGLCFDEVGPDLMLNRLPGVFAAGEMLDWEAPTGGYLLQACFASGVRAAKGIRRYLAAG